MSGSPDDPGTASGAVAAIATTGNAGAPVRLVQVAVPSPLYGVFDYRWRTHEAPRRARACACRSVGGTCKACWWRRFARSDVPSARLRAVADVLDAEPILPPEMLSLLSWASRYYHHPIGEVLAGALPVALRRGEAAVLTTRESWSLSPSAVALARRRLVG